MKSPLFLPLAKPMKREADLIDGLIPVMPYAQWHYPLKTKIKLIKQRFSS
jgi:hypothetical protein